MNPLRFDHFLFTLTTSPWSSATRQVQPRGGNQGTLEDPRRPVSGTLAGSPDRGRGESVPLVIVPPPVLGVRVVN